MTTKTRRSRAWLLVSAAWIVPAAFAAINRVVQSHLAGWDPVGAKELLWVSGDWFLYAFLTPAVFLFSRRWPIERPYVARRVALHLAMSLVFCVIWATTGKLFQGLLGVIFDVGAAPVAADHWVRLTRAWMSWVFITFPFGIAVYLCEVGVEHALRLWVESRDREVQVARLSEQLSGARLAALQARINPHFLFNSLNTVAVLVREGDTGAAARAIEQLSDVLRRTLDRRGTDEVSLDEELALSRQYLAVEQARFSDRLRPEFLIDADTLSAAIPSFAIQHLIENAIRHGIAGRTNAGRIVIAARRVGAVLEISVTDDGPGIATPVELPGHGLANTRERLLTLYGGSASLEIVPGDSTGTIATLRLPYKEMIFEQGEVRDARE